LSTKSLPTWDYPFNARFRKINASSSIGFSDDYNNIVFPIMITIPKDTPQFRIRAQKLSYTFKGSEDFTSIEWIVREAPATFHKGNHDLANSIALTVYAGAHDIWPVEWKYLDWYAKRLY
jgi:hypothetical protein